jgi:hypothetical protein
MKNKIVLVLVLVLLAPVIANASWWNPISWFDWILNRTNITQTTEISKSTQPIKTSKEDVSPYKTRIVDGNVDVVKPDKIPYYPLKSNSVDSNSTPKPQTTTVAPAKISYPQINPLPLATQEQISNIARLCHQISQSYCVQVLNAYNTDPAFRATFDILASQYNANLIRQQQLAQQYRDCVTNMTSANTPYTGMMSPSASLYAQQQTTAICGGQPPPSEIPYKLEGLETQLKQIQDTLRRKELGL